MCIIKNRNEIISQANSLIADLCPYSYGIREDIEKYLNEEMKGGVFSSVTNWMPRKKAGKFIKNNCPQTSAGNSIESIMSDILETYVNTEDHPNGQYEFPDFRIKGINIDCKAVICKEDIHGDVKPNYNCGTESKKSIMDKLADFVNTGNTDAFTQSLIALVYYKIREDMCVEILDVLVVPILMFLRISGKNNSQKFSVRYENHNDVVYGGIRFKKGVDEYDYSQYINDIITAWNNEYRQCK